MRIIELIEDHEKNLSSKRFMAYVYGFVGVSLCYTGGDLELIITCFSASAAHLGITIFDRMSRKNGKK